MAKKNVEEAQMSLGFSPGDFVNETKEEFAKVVWPDRQQLISESVAVILMVAMSAILISLFDGFFQWLSELVF